MNDNHCLTFPYITGSSTINIKPHQQDVSPPIRGEDILEYKFVISCIKSPQQQSPPHQKQLNSLLSILFSGGISQVVQCMRGSSWAQLIWKQLYRQKLHSVITSRGISSMCPHNTILTHCIATDNAKVGQQLRWENGWGEWPSKREHNLHIRNKTNCGIQGGRWGGRTNLCMPVLIAWWKLAQTGDDISSINK